MKIARTLVMLAITLGWSRDAADSAPVEPFDLGALVAVSISPARGGSAVVGLRYEHGITEAIVVAPPLSNARPFATAYSRPLSAIISSSGRESLH